MTNNLLIYNRFIPSVKLCAYEQICYLSKSGKVRFRHCRIERITKELIRDSDVVIMVRSDSYLEEALARMFKKMGKYLVYVLDDDLLNVPLGISSSKHYQSDEVKNRIRNIMSFCDCLVSPSEKILGKYGSTFRRTGLIEEPVLVYKEPAEKEIHKIKVGFAGSTDRTEDIDNLLSDGIQEIMKKYKNKVEIEFFGAKPNFIESMGLTYFPYENSYQDYQKKMWELNWHIGLAPLSNSEFHRYKHYNKYIEYCATATIGIYSNVYPYTEVIKDEENGFLCENTREAWIDKISYCIDNYDRLGHVREKIKNSTKVNFSIERTARLFSQVVPEVLEYKADNQNLYVSWFSLYYLKAMHFMVKSMDYIKRNGIKTPIILFRKLWKALQKA